MHTGILLGHDAFPEHTYHGGVRKAVNQFTRERQLRWHFVGGSMYMFFISKSESLPYFMSYIDDTPASDSV